MNIHCSPLCKEDSHTRSAVQIIDFFGMSVELKFQQESLQVSFTVSDTLLTDTSQDTCRSKQTG